MSSTKGKNRKNRKFLGLNWGSVYDMLIYWKEDSIFGLKNMVINFANLMILPYVAMTVGKHCY